MYKNTLLWMGLFLLFFPISLAAQTVSPSSDDFSDSPLAGEIKTTQDEITLLSDQKMDIDLEFRHQQRLYLEDLMRDKADRLRQAGDAKKADEMLKALDEFETSRHKEWDLDQELLEKQSHLRQLNWDRLTKRDQGLLDKFNEKGLSKRAKETEEAIKFFAQMKEYENQNLDLKKKLFKAREFYDYKTADDIRKQIKDLKDQVDDLTKKVRSSVNQIENSENINEENL